MEALTPAARLFDSFFHFFAMYPFPASGLRAGLLLVACAFPFASLYADTIRLKNGEKLEGTIIEEKPDSVKIEVKIGRATDWVVKQRKEIAEIIKSTKDEIEATELKKLVPTKDRMSDVEYQKVIKEQLEPFIKKYPTSRYRKEVEGILKTYQEEMEKAKAGAMKLEGEWVSPEEMDWNRYNIEARLKRIEMQQQIKAEEHYKAYRSYLELENEKPASVEYVKALEEVKTILPKLDRQLELHAERQPQLMKARENNLKTLSAEQRRRVEDAFRNEANDFKVELEEARKAKVAIPPFYIYDLKSIQDSRMQIVREQARLDKLDVEKLKTGAEQFQRGLKLMFEKNYAPALKELEAAGRLFQKDAYVKETVEAAKKAAKEAEVASAVAGVTPPAVGTVASAAGTPEKTEGGDSSSKAAAKPAAKPPVRKSTETPAATPPPVEEDNNNIVMILLGAAGVLLVAGIIAKVAGKKKAAAASEE